VTIFINAVSMVSRGCLHLWYNFKITARYTKENISTAVAAVLLSGLTVSSSG
jgi:hypothetical protein